MKVGLGMIVGLNQSAFVPNRHIQDNILLSQELLKGYDRKEGPKRIAMKIDIQNAYDTVNWQFLGVLLRVLVFIARCNYGVLGRYDIFVPALTKDHKGKKINTPYPGKPIRRIQALWE
ncbi:RNA-directed DNA polymerase, eukaryota, reverse transcriptase zinc-binding domain protein [Tanacetum coccineum]